MNTKRFLYLWGLVVFFSAAAVGPALAQKNDRPSSVLNVRQPAVDTPGDGYLVGGDIWDTVKPMNTSEPGRLGSAWGAAPLNMNNRILFGSRGNWQEPAGTWPSGYPWSNKFRNSHFMWFPLYKATGWPGYVKGNPVREKDANADAEGVGGSSRFMFAIYGPNVPGASDPTRNYKRPAYWADQSRTHMVYESGWPTTAGIDFKLRAHQYSMNEQNLNDFIVLEISLTNTGIVDSNGDGTPEATGNVIDGVAMDISATISPSIQISTAGDRGCNCIAAGRTFGYAARDVNGEPLDMFVYYANVPATATANRATPSLRNFGIIGYNLLEGYADIWNGWNWMGVRQGKISDGPTGGPSASSPDKSTLFGSHSVGQGARRGWYTSSEWKGGSSSDSQKAFQHSTATWYADYGKLTDPSTNQWNLAPNPNYFSGGDPGKIETWTVGNPNARPNGDFKYASEDISKAVGIEQPVWEPLWNPGAASNSFYDGAVGYTKEYTFSQNPSSSIGPFKLEVGESMTIVWVQVMGYRLEGIYDAMRAARWAWDKGWDIKSAMPTPAAPDMMVESTTNGRARIAWTNADGVAGRPIDGYKIWRASQYKRTPYLERGLRISDKYQHQHQVGGNTDALLEPVNPNFNAASVFKGDIQGSYQPAEWGTYDLVAKIPKNDLNQYTQNVPNGFAYAWEDPESITGFTYWYYVSAYKDGAVTGPLGQTAGHLESSNLNRNGRNAPEAPAGTIGLATPWTGTYPYAFRAAAFPKAGTVAYDNLGAPFTVTPPPAPANRVAELITVTPNPYKITGLNDVRNRPESHNIDFLNLPTDYTLTIFDVSGQIIFQNSVTGAVDGKYTWDMFSKDGNEVASGLYIYHVQFDGGEAQGHFAILR